MRKKSGILIIILSMLVTVILWVGAKPTRTIPAITQYSELLASLALIAFAFINFISTRNKILDDLFAGLDRAYIYHKYLSISALTIVVIHDIAISIGKRVQRSEGIRIPRDPYAMYGSSDYAPLSFSAFSIWMNIINITGILSAVYSVFIYERAAFKYKFKVSKLDVVANGTLEITASSKKTV